MMNIRSLPLALLASVPLSSVAYEVVTDEHVDIQIVYASGSLSGKIAPEGGGMLDLGETLLFDGPSGSTAVTRPGGAEWDFLGVGAGETLYFWPQGALDGRTYLGFASDKGTVPNGTFKSYFEADSRVEDTAAWNKVSLLDVRFHPAPGESAGPAHFSLWNFAFGEATVWMSSFENGITADDATWVLGGGHEHFNWGFTKRGHYEIDLRFSGFLNAGGAYIESAPLTYHFGVEFLPANIPEPGTATLALLGAGALALSRRRGRKTART